ncbi:MAG: Polysaccharide deacetylase family protein [Verrucomicrobiota bacterium]|jgi:peptidoglycan/xylan/chitin deacetylase (PgdA/CDA1 family)
MLGPFTKYIYLGAVQRRLYGNGPVILMYHRVGPAPREAPDPFLYDTAEDLDLQLTAAREAGLKFVSLAEAIAGGQPQPNTLAVTFDDGCLSTLVNALPVLVKHKVRATQFIVAGRIGGLNEWDISKDDVPTPLMSASQIREWLAAGQDIGSHTVTHRNLRKVSAQAARAEICDSKKQLEDIFSLPIRHFAFPYGGWRKAEVRELVKEAGYEAACVTDFGVSTSSEELWNLRRISPLSDRQLVQKILHRGLRRINIGLPASAAMLPHVASHAHHLHRLLRPH